MYVRTFLMVSDVRSLEEVRPVLAKLGPTDLVGEAVKQDIADHTQDREGRPRLVAELKLACNDQNLNDNPSTCLSLATSAIEVGEKGLAKEFLHKMMNCSDFTPRYARVLKDYYQERYDDLMVHASH